VKRCHLKRAVIKRGYQDTTEWALHNTKIVIKLFANMVKFKFSEMTVTSQNYINK
jgi:hypothetical protein